MGKKDVTELRERERDNFEKKERLQVERRNKEALEAMN